jgi:hypothetical protein
VSEVGQTRSTPRHHTHRRRRGRAGPEIGPAHAAAVTARRSELEKLAGDLPGLWHASTTSHKDRKRLLRNVITDIALLREPDQHKARIGIHWHTGATDEIAVAHAAHSGTAKRSPSPAVAMVIRLGPPRLSRPGPEPRRRDQPRPTQGSAAAAASSTGRTPTGVTIMRSHRLCSWAMNSGRGRLKAGLGRRNNKSLNDLARMVNSIVQGWINYYRRFYRSELLYFLRRLNRYLVRWATRKYRWLKRRDRRAMAWLAETAHRSPHLFTHWRIGASPDRWAMGADESRGSRPVLREPGVRSLPATHLGHSASARPIGRTRS